MLTIRGPKLRCCDGLSRRNFLRVGAISLGGLTLPELWRQTADAGNAASKKSVINVYLGGGPSHIDTFDLKPEAPREIRGEFSPIETCVPGIRICEHLPQIAANMQRFTIIRSLTGIVDEHSSHQTESGWNSSTLKSLGGHPSFGSVIAKVQGTSNGNCPTFIDLNGVSRPGFLGPVYSGFRPDGEGRANLTLNQITLDRLGHRQVLLTELDRLRRDVDNSGMLQAMDSFTARAVDVVTSGALAQALDVSRENPQLRQRYNLRAQPNQNDSFLVARRLVEAGARCVSLSWGGWDTHSENFKQLRQMLPALDQGLTTLTADLEERGMLDDTVVLAWGEFGRTPRINTTGGRDHWPRAASVLVAGGGWKAGQVIGATGRLGEEPRDRPVHLQQVFASLYQHMGIDARHVTLVDPNGRPQYLVERPEPIRELMA